MKNIKQIWKAAHRAARIDFYAVEDFPGFGHAAQYAVGQRRDRLAARQRGEAPALCDLARQRANLKQTAFGRMMLELAE